MFGRLYAGEVKKLFRPKAMIILSVVLLLLLVAYAIFYNLVGTVTQMLSETVDIDGVQVPGFTQDYTFSEETIDAAITMQEGTVAELEEAYKTEKNGYNYYATMFSEKSKLVALKYIKENNLYGKDARFLGVNYTIGGANLTADGFVRDYMSVVTSVISIYIIVIGAGLLADEYKNGTIKLLLTRPISKSQLITAKYLASLTVALGMASLFAFIGYIYGLIAFTSEATTPVYLVFNASSVVKSTVGAYLFGEFFLNLMRIAVMGMIAYFIGTVTRKKTTGIIVTIIIHIGIISAILGLLPVQIALLLPNMKLMDYFVPSAAVPIYGNFFLSLAIYVVYVAAVTFGLYFAVNKRDVI